MGGQKSVINSPASDIKSEEVVIFKLLLYREFFIVMDKRRYYMIQSALVFLS